MTTSTVTPEIAKFAQGVRAALADLPADEVDDLTDGLEADLAEAYAEDLQRELPDPSAYAAELRLAAGLPVRTKVKQGLFSGLGAGFSDTRRDIGIAIRGNPTLNGIAEFLVTLRPAWWVLRAWLATWLLAAFFGSEEGYWFNAVGWFFVLAAFVAVSVQWGRGEWRRRGASPFIAIGNVVAIVALLPVMAAADSWDDGSAGSFDEGYSAGSDSVLNDQSTEGLVLNGKTLENIYAYGADGKPLTNVQLFDQSGKPIDLFGHRADDGVPCAGGSDECSDLVQPGTLETGQTTYNLFPLGTIAAQWDDSKGESVPTPGAKVKYGPAPFVQVPAVMSTPKAQSTP